MNDRLPRALRGDPTDRWSATPVRTAVAVDALADPAPGMIAPEMIRALGLARRALGGRAALLGFAGAPWSLAASLTDTPVDSVHALIAAVHDERLS